MKAWHNRWSAAKFSVQCRKLLDTQSSSHLAGEICSSDITQRNHVLFCVNCVPKLHQSCYVMFIEWCFAKQLNPLWSSQTVSRFKTLRVYQEVMLLELPEFCILVGGQPNPLVIQLNLNKIISTYVRNTRTNFLILIREFCRNHHNPTNLGGTLPQKWASI